MGVVLALRQLLAREGPAFPDDGAYVVVNPLSAKSVYRMLCVLHCRGLCGAIDQPTLRERDADLLFRKDIPTPRQKGVRRLGT